MVNLPAVILIMSCHTEGKRRQLLEQAEELIKTYNPKRTTLESHANEYLSINKLNANDADGAFLKEVLYGVMRCKAALKVFAACFFNDMSARVLRSDYTMYMILTYLSVFRLQELTISEFRKFVLSIDPDKMVNFLEYVFNASSLEDSGVVAHWTKIFDPDYVRNTLLKQLTSSSLEIQQIIAELRDKSTGITAAKQASKDCGTMVMTPGQRKEVKPPKLTAPVPRVVPEPSVIEQELSCKSSGFVADMTPERRVTGKLENTICHPIALHGTRSTVLVAQEAMETKRVDQLDFSRTNGSKGKCSSSVRFRSALKHRRSARGEPRAKEIIYYAHAHRWQW